MREFKDKIQGLSFLIPEVANPDSEYPEFISDDQKLIDEFTKELNQYKDDKIRRYVTGNDCQDLGTFIIWSIIGKKRPCYIYEKGNLAGCMVLTPNTNIQNINALIEYIQRSQYIQEYTKYLAQQNSDLLVKNFRSYKSLHKALRISTDNNNMSIDYLAVVPPKQNQGIGSNTIASIIENTSFFAPESPIDTITTEVHTENKKSARRFKENGFIVFANNKYDCPANSTNEYIYVKE